MLLSALWISFVYIPLRTVASVPIIPTFLFFVVSITLLTPGSTTPTNGMSKAFLSSSREFEDTVLQAIIIAFTFFVIKKRTICLEYLVTTSFDFAP